jgi:hypothetical protein
MPAKRKRKLSPRLTYEQRAEKEYRAAIKAAIPVNGAVFDYLTERCLEHVDMPANCSSAKAIYDAGKSEGYRCAYGELLAISMTDLEED